MTRGQYARLMEGAEAIEIKATIPPKQVATALAHYKLTHRNDEQRFIYFFDTPKLELLAAGIVARARRVVGDEHDSTIKSGRWTPRRSASAGGCTATSRSRRTRARRAS